MKVYKFGDGVRICLNDSEAKNAGGLGVGLPAFTLKPYLVKRLIDKLQDYNDKQEAIEERRNLRNTMRSRTKDKPCFTRCVFNLSYNSLFQGCVADSTYYGACTKKTLKEVVNARR